MFQPRVIPVLLVKDNGLVKSKKFKDFRYIGDPMNAVRIFNTLRVHELIFIDISATAEKRLISLDLVKSIGEEADMPFAVGGGIKTLDDIRRIIGAGAEKVVINTHAVENIDFVSRAADTFGSSTIIICIDVKKNFFGKEKTWILNGSRSTGYSPVNFAKLMAERGAGEIIVQSIKKDGSMSGYDVDLVKRISEAVTIPVIALGGAGTLEHMKKVYNEGRASGLAAGSMFVYHGARNGVLINYPEKPEIRFNQE